MQVANLALAVFIICVSASLNLKRKLKMKYYYYNSFTNSKISENQATAIGEYDRHKKIKIKLNKNYAEIYNITQEQIKDMMNNTNSEGFDRFVAHIVKKELNVIGKLTGFDWDFQKCIEKVLELNIYKSISQFTHEV